MGRLEDLRAEHVNIMNRLREAEAKREVLHDQAVKSINALEAQKRVIEQMYELLLRVEDEIMRLS